MPTTLRVTGRVQRTLELDFDQLSQIQDGQVADVSQIDSSRRGAAIRLDALLADAQADDEAQQLTIESADGFRACVPLEAVRQRALLIYALDGQPLPRRFGGPVRFLVPDAAECGLAEVDTCKNVKRVTVLSLV